MTTLFIMALVAIMMVKMVVRFVRSAVKAIPSVEVGVAVDADLCHFRNQWDFGPTKIQMKALRLQFRRARQHAWHKAHCNGVHEARKARSSAMEGVTKANEEAAALRAAVVFMTGKSWQQALHMMCRDGTLVCSGSGSVAAPATVKGHIAKAVKGKTFISSPSKMEGVHAKDTAFCASHTVVRTKGVPVLCTWNNYRKIVPMGRVMLLVQRREAAMEKANKMAIQALERHLKIAAWNAIQAAKVAA